MKRPIANNDKIILSDVYIHRFDWKSEYKLKTCFHLCYLFFQKTVLLLADTLQRNIGFLFESGKPENKPLFERAPGIGPVYALLQEAK